MKTKLFLLLLLLSVNVFSVDYYKCKPEKSYRVSDSGFMEGKDWLIGGAFTIDRVSGEFRSNYLNSSFRVTHKGDKDRYFRASLENSGVSWPHILVVEEFSDSIKKPYVLMSASASPSVSSGLCERF